MYIDKDKRNLTSEQKLGKYNILLSILKIVAVFLFIFIESFIIYLILKYKFILFSHMIILIFTLLHLYLFSRIKEYKFVWLILIILFPILGALIYFLAGNNSFSKKKKYILNNIEKQNLGNIENIDSEKVEELDNILNNLSRHKIYKNEGIKFFNKGEEFFGDLLDEIKNAKKSILIDIYILSKGVLLDNIINILKEKVKEGVIVEIMYDDFGSMFKVSKKIRNDIKKSGIKLYKYKKINFNIPDYINHREHKKIFIIDGKIAYTGGINISDEYINKKELHRVWKDGGIKVYGNIVLSYLAMYLKTKEEITHEKINYKDYLIDEKYESQDGFVFSYSDGPDNDKNPVENIFINVINNSKEYLYIVTPYFIPSKKIVDSIKNVARRGVKVEILLPHIPDKKIILYANRSYYKELIESGVQIYEYKKGFIHTKYILSDNISVVGTANLDYKSLYFNYECMNLSYDTGIENKIKEEFEKDIKDAIFVNLEDIKNQNWFEKIKESIAHFFAPLL